MSRLPFALALCSMLGACSSVTDANRAVVVNLSSDRSVVNQATPATITITMVNYGPTAIEVAEPASYECMPPFEVTNASGSSIQLPGRACFAIPHGNVSVAPGDSLVIRDRWSGDQAGSASNPMPAPAGTYRLAARLVAKDRIITSPPINLLVTAPQ